MDKNKNIIKYITNYPLLVKRFTNRHIPMLHEKITKLNQ